MLLAIPGTGLSQNLLPDMLLFKIPKATEISIELGAQTRTIAFQFYIKQRFPPYVFPPKAI